MAAPQESAHDQRLDGVSQASGAETNSFLRVVNQIYDIRHEICKHLRPRDILALSGSTKQLSHLKTDHWDINRLLGEYVKDPLVLRNLQASTATLISGPAITDLIRHGHPVWDGNLNMFTYKRDLQKWLDFWAGEGYTTDPNNSPTNSGFIELKKMSKPASESEEPFCEARVRLWSVHCPVETFFKSIRMSFEATVVTWDKMYTLFPYQTLISEYACMIGEMLDSHGQVMAYHKWPASRIAGDYDHAPVEDFFQTKGQRRHIGDVETFTLQLDTQGIQQPDSVFRIELCEFWFGLSDDYDRECCMIDTETIENNPMFRFGYTVCPRYRENAGAEDGTPLTLIKDEYLPNLFALQVLSLPKDQRPPDIVVSFTGGFGRSGILLNHEFSWSDLKDWKPPTDCDWEFMDDLLPGWIKSLDEKGETRHGYDVLPFGPQE